MGAAIVAVPLGASAALCPGFLNPALSLNGSACLFAGTGAHTGEDRGLPKLSNASGSTQKVVCPVTRYRQESNMSGASIMTTPDVDGSTCKLIVRRWSDGVAASYARTDTVNVGGNLQTRWLFNPQAQPGSNSSIALYCDLPPGAAVLTYTFDGELTSGCQ